jgi:hypothetical protein
MSELNIPLVELVTEASRIYGVNAEDILRKERTTSSASAARSAVLYALCCYGLSYSEVSNMTGRKSPVSTSRSVAITEHIIENRDSPKYKIPAEKADHLVDYLKELMFNANVVIQQH